MTSGEERRRRMTLRGRLTIAAGLGLVAGAAGLAWLTLAPVPEAGPELPPVGARPPSLALPESALGPPTSRAALSARDPDVAAWERTIPGPGGSDLHLRYTLDPELTAALWKVLKRGRVALGHVVVMHPQTGELLAYVSTDNERFPPTRTYPAASLVKVITAAAALDQHDAELECRYRGNPWRLSRSKLDPPKSGNTASLRRALATSNNQCFAQWAVHRIGGEALVDAIGRFGMLRPPAPGHSAGQAEAPGDDALALGRLGSGLDGLAITPLHAAQLAATLVEGRLVAPRWIDAAWDDTGRRFEAPGDASSQVVMTPELAERLRTMLVDTTLRGTARRAFRTRRGRPLLGPVRVAGKTGSLSGDDPKGRYEWFVGVAPASDPQVAVAAVAVQSPLYWMSASQLAAESLKAVFCPKGVCRTDAAERWIGAGGGPGVAR